MRRGAVIVALLGVFSSAVSCGRNEASGPPAVTVIGIDGATWRVIDPLLARGELPNLARLVETGVRGPLRSQIPLVSPALWTTIATGVSRERHGILNFNREQGGLVSSDDRKVAALWDLTTRAGLRTALIGWWATYPAEPIDGAVISERALKIRDEDVQGLFGGSLPTASFSRLVHPPELMGLVGDLISARPAPVDDEYADQLNKMRAEDAAVTGSLLRMREKWGPFDLELVLLRGLDPVCHYFWKFHEPEAPVYAAEERPSQAEVTARGGVVEDYYRYVDSLLGELDARGAPDRVVILLSDHGFEAGHQPFHRGVLSGTHESEETLDGIFVASGGPLRRGARIEGMGIADVAPTILHLLGLPVADDLDGRARVDALDEGWSRVHPIQRVARFEPPARDAGGESRPTPVDERLSEELKALGYVE